MRVMPLSEEEKVAAMGRYFGREPRYSQEEAEAQAKAAIDAAVQKGRPPAEEWKGLASRTGDINRELATRPPVDLPPPPPRRTDTKGDAGTAGRPRAVSQILRPQPAPAPEPAAPRRPAAKPATKGSAPAATPAPAKRAAKASAPPPAPAKRATKAQAAPAPAKRSTRASAPEPGAAPAKRSRRAAEPQPPATAKRPTAKKRPG